MSEQIVSIESVLHESRIFPPPPEFAAAAHLKSFAEYEQLYAEAAADPAAFWARQAEALHWFKPWEKVLEWNLPFAKWFVGGKLNLSYNCLDRHITTHRNARQRRDQADVWLAVAHRFCDLLELIKDRVEQR